MKFIIFLISIMVIFPAWAGDKPALNMVLAAQAIELSATVDAQGEYCKKPSTLSADYIKRYEELKINAVKLKEFKNLQEKTYAQALEGLKTEKKDCKQVEFLLQRLELMRSLKDVSYQLNGIDPASVKDSIPPVELLAPGLTPRVPETKGE